MQSGEVCPLAALAVQIAIAAFGDTIHDAMAWVGQLQLQLLRLLLQLPLQFPLPN